MALIVIFSLGAVIGSFISALTWRIPRGINYSTDRSRCDKCNSVIAWYDNIPIFSYIFLQGKCRNCNKKVSIRYPLLEISTGLIFVITYLFFINCVAAYTDFGVLYNSCRIFTDLGNGSHLYLFFISAVLISIFVTDIELQIIPDEFVFSLLCLNLVLLPLFFPETLFERLISGFGASIFLLLLNIITKGRGMGLGDVKLALAVGTILGIKLTFVWLFLSFIIGAGIGMAMVLARLTKFGKHIPFGPFLVASFFVSLFWGDKLLLILFPYLR